MNTIENPEGERNFIEEEKGVAQPWPVRVDLDTRRFIRQAAAKEGKSLPEFFRIYLRPYCQNLIAEKHNVPLIEPESSSPDRFVRKDDFDMFKTELLTIIEQAQPQRLVDRLKHFLLN